MLNQGFVFAADRASQAADAMVAADTNAAYRDLDVALHSYRLVADRVGRRQARRVAAKADVSAMLRALRTAR